VLLNLDCPIAMLIRPDGHVAWVGGRDDAGLNDASTTWFGAVRSEERVHG
jgi:hypothetical protein